MTVTELQELALYIGRQIRWDEHLCLTAYFLDPHMRSTVRRLYSDMAANKTSAELV